MRKILLSGTVLALPAVAAWIMMLLVNPTASVKPKPTGYPIAKTIQYSYTLQNQTNRAIEKAEFWAHAPVKQTAGQRCQDLTGNYPFQLLTDDAGNQVLYFTFENLAPYASRIITIKAHLLVSPSANPVADAPKPSDLQPEKHIESDSPAIRRLAAKLQESDVLSTIKAVFHWVANHVSYSGYTAQDRGALYALKHQRGDCTEFMDLFVALCRANGIPARRMGGYLCSENTVLKARDYHNWGEFYQDNTWQIADPQNNALMQRPEDYIAMRIIRASGNGPLGPYHRFRVRGQGLKAKMN
jgi:transglutaminase-like putative cysteine protease